MPGEPVFPIIEIFDSIQGEGSWIGIPCTFIRLGGCNLRCEWCDTKKSWKECETMPLSAIVAKIHYSHVVITGGEPTIHTLEPLLTSLKKLNDHIQIAIETNGTNEIPQFIDWVVVSPKPDANFQIVPEPDELKYVVDSTFSVAVIPHEYRGKISIWLQPNAFELQKSMKRALKLVMAHEFLRLGVQLHKIYHVQ